MDPKNPAPGAAPAGAAPTTTPPADPPAPQGTDAPKAPPSQDPSKTAQPPDAPKDAPKPAAVPAELAIKLPEGKKADQKQVDGYLATAKKFGLSQEQAQGIVDHFIAVETETAKQWDGALKGAVEKNDADLRADKDWGGAKYDATLKAADSAQKQFFSEGWTKFLQDLGAHNHPEYRKGLALIRSLIAEDSVGDKKASAPVVPETREAQLKRMFPNSPGMFDPNAPLVPAGTPPA